MLKTANSVLTNQFFLMLLSIATRLLTRRIKVKSFFLGASGGILTGIAIGCLTTRQTRTVSRGGVGYADVKGVLSTGVVAQVFFTFPLLPFLVPIGLEAGSNTGAMFEGYGVKLVVIGVSIPVVSILVAYILYGNVLPFNQSITPSETIRAYVGSMTAAPGYGTALDAAGHVDYGTFYKEASEEGKGKTLPKIDPSGTLSRTDIATLSEEQVAAYKEAASSAISLSCTVAFPMGVLVIIVMFSVLPKLSRIDTERKKKNYQKETSEMSESGKTAKEPSLDFMMMSLAAVTSIIVRNITIPLDSFGSFLMGAAGRVPLAALILSYIGQVGSMNFKMDSKAFGIVYQMGLTFFTAVAGLRYGYNVVTSLVGPGLALAVTVIFVEMTAVFISLFIGRKLFGLNWVILGGTIADGYTSTPGLGVTISSTGSEEPTAGYDAAQPFAILANALLAAIFFNIILQGHVTMILAYRKNVCSRICWKYTIM